ncbi:MAG TPA: PfkB family carbohydrate kinase [Kiritimatiellia bacterium]|nr:PfkB family carbohydrate kinase [Kiritimatiellia bacterium]HPS07943.1 PfkB family carbohydrate kinase [Kiritimatiellia bacterium]
MISPLQTFDTNRLEALTARFSGTRVAVLGDFFLDKYFDIDPALAETSVETGRCAHQVVGIQHSPGAAGTVVNNLAALGARRIVTLGFTGEDGEGWELRQDLSALGCDLTHLHIAPECVTPTYLKPCDRTRPGIAGEHDRYDVKNRHPVPARVGEALLASLDAVLPRVDALIVMDQVPEEGQGVMFSALIAALAERAPHFPRAVFWADSRRRIRQYRNVMVKPNQFELVGEKNPSPGASVPDDVLFAETEAFAAAVGAPVFATAEHRGVRVSGPDPVTIPPVNVSGPIDPTGAGDSFTAGAVLALAAGATRPEAALIGNLVASVTIRQLGTTGTAKPADLFPAWALWEEQQS